MISTHRVELPRFLLWSWRTRTTPEKLPSPNACTRRAQTCRCVVRTVSSWTYRP